MGEAKQVIVVRKDLKMNKGKSGAQIAHAVMGQFLQNVRWDGISHGKMTGTVEVEGPWIEWLKDSHTKITVSVFSEEELLALYDKAKDLGIPAQLIRDQGRTAFNGVPTYTCLCLGPSWPQEIDPLTGDLPLY